MPSFLHSTSVVPVPQKGSSTLCRDPIPNRDRYSRTRCGGKERTNRYQSCTGRSWGCSLLVSWPFACFSFNIPSLLFRNLAAVLVVLHRTCCYHYRRIGNSVLRFTCESKRTLIL